MEEYSLKYYSKSCLLCENLVNTVSLCTNTLTFHYSDVFPSSCASETSSCQYYTNCSVSNGKSNDKSNGLSSNVRRVQSSTGLIANNNQGNCCAYSKCNWTEEQNQPMSRVS